MNDGNIIECDSIAELTEMVAGLVRQCVTFKSNYNRGVWIIELTGGF